MVEADAIVVLGCKVSGAGEPCAALLRRIDLAVRAFDAEMAPRIIASGGRRWGEHIESLVIQQALLARGVPADCIDVELFSLSTAENCWFTAEILGTSAKRVVLATCTWHMRRAAYGFRRLGIVAVCPPEAWLTTPPPTVARRVRERVNMFVDWYMMPRDRYA